MQKQQLPRRIRLILVSRDHFILTTDDKPCIVYRHFRHELTIGLQSQVKL